MIQQTLNLLAKHQALSDGDMEPFARVVTQCAVESLDAIYQSSVWLFSTADKRQLQCIALHKAETGAGEDLSVWNAAEYPDYFSAIGQSRILDAGDTFRDPRTLSMRDSYLYPRGIRALLDIPIRHQGDTVGVLSCEYTQVMEWTERQIHFTAQLGDQLSLAYANHYQRKNRSMGQFIKDCYDALFKASADAIFICMNNIVIECNPAALTLFKASDKAEIVSKRPLDFFPEYQPDGRHSETVALEYMSSALSGRERQFGWHYQNLSGKVFASETTLTMAESGGKKLLLAVIKDLEDSTSVGERLFYQTTSCRTTGLLNRHSFMMSLSTQTAPHFLMMIEIKNLKVVTEILGQNKGDLYLRQIATRLREHLEPHGAQVGRIFGKQFAAIVPIGQNMLHPQLEQLAAEILDSLAEPIVMEGLELPVGCHIALLQPEIEHRNTDTAWRNIGITMEEAKQDDQPMLWFEDNFAEKAQVRSMLITDLKAAIEGGQLYLLYQPKMNLANNSITSVEALIRWNHPEKGLVAPEHFISLAEKTDIINGITRWVIDTACAQVVRWRACGLDLQVAINLSPRNLNDVTLPSFISHTLAKYHLDPSDLSMEITENALMGNSERALATLREIGDLGIAFAIDDYGTGYSSLSYLSKLPISTLKIDRVFIKDLVTSAHDQVIVPSTINMAHGLNLDVVAEGIEDGETLDLLRSMNCDVIQGYFISKPVTAEEMEPLLKTLSYALDSELVRVGR